MKILLSTIAFTNPILLDKCLNSWFKSTPKDLHKGILWQGNHLEMESVIKEHKDKLNVYIKRINNWGVSGGWNIILREAFKQKYDGIVIVGSDTEMLSGFWESFYNDIDKYDFVESTHQFNCFYISRKCFEIVGSFDENLFPAYVEDDDFRTRVTFSEKRFGIKYKINQGKKELLLHEGSAVVKNLNDIGKLRARKSYQLNKEYMHKKWGGFENTKPKWIPVFEHPFNNPNWPLEKWVLDPIERIKKLWDNIYEDKDDDRLIHLMKAINCPDKYVYNYKT